MKDLRLARCALIKDRTAARNRAKQLRQALLRRQNGQRLRQIERDFAAIDAAIEALIAGDDGLARRARILVAFPASRPSPPSPCWSRCPSSAPSTRKRRRAWQG